MCSCGRRVRVAVVSEQLELPGMRDPDDRDTPMVRAAHHTLNALRAAGMLTVRHGLLVQLTLSLSGAIDRGVSAGRASAVAMASRELRETLLMLDPPPEETGATVEAQRRLVEFMDKLEYAANHNGEMPPAPPGVGATGQDP